MDIGNYTALEQKQSLSQSQIQALELLSMDNIELYAFMQNEYLENPTIEYTESTQTPSDMQEFMQWYDKNRFSHRAEEGFLGEEEHREGKEASVNREETVEQYILSQINMAAYSKEEQKLMEFLIQNLNKDGFMELAPAEISKMCRLPEETVKRCLEDLQQLEPYGIFAPDLPHALLRQLEVLGICDEQLNTIILHHLEDIGTGKISSISRVLHLTTVQVRKYAAVIGSLNPKPLTGFYSGENAYIVPDIIIKKENDEWNIQMNDNWMGDYRLSDYYMRLMSETKDEELFSYFKAKLERARFLVHSIEQRRETVLKIVTAVVRRQEVFFLGKGSLKPMTMAEVAEEIQMHPSTIGRGIKNKYLQYAGGTVLMKELFSGAIGKEDAEEGITAVEIKRILKELVNKEDKAKPYSDSKLEKLIKERGIVISRRAIAKYRDELGIKGSFDRKIL